MSETPDDNANPHAVLIFDQDQSRQASLEGFSDFQGWSGTRLNFSPPSAHSAHSMDDSVSPDPSPVLSRLEQKNWLDSLPDCQNNFPISRNSRDENEGSSGRLPNRSQQRDLSTSHIPQVALDVISRIQLRNIPEQRATDPVGVSTAGLQFLASLPERQGQPQRRRSAFSQIRRADRESDVPQPIPESDPLLQLHPEAAEFLRNFGLIPNGQRFSWDANLVFPDPITMNQPGDNLHKTFAVDVLIHQQRHSMLTDICILRSYLNH